MTEATLGVPYRLERVKGTSGARQQLVARSGNGADAGWTVQQVPCSQLAAFLRALPLSAYMPGTYRLARKQGSLLYTCI